MLWWVAWLGCSGNPERFGRDKHDLEPLPTPCGKPVCWVELEGGAFEMGARPEIPAERDEKPRHTVTVPSFSLMATEVPVQVHRGCVEDGACEALPEDMTEYCLRAEDFDAQGCLDWYAADALCRWLGGRLPSEAEWEFAARSRGEDLQFPWGEAPPTCDLAVLGYVHGDPCGEDGLAQVCSRPLSNTDQGLCDMAGNIFEWVEDWYRSSYRDAPDDGSAWLGDPTGFRVLRGGGINSDEPVSTWNRTYHEPDFSYSGMGVRCARDVGVSVTP